MTQPQPHDAGDNTKQPPAGADNANNNVQQKLFDDLQGRYFPGANKQENVTQLVKDGILPQGSTVIDMGTVKDHLKDDQQKLTDLNGKQPADTKPATQALTDAQGVQTTAQQNLDKAEAAAKPVSDRIDGRTKQDAEVKADFDKVSKSSGKDSLYKEDLTKIAGDQSKPQDVRDAASRLLGTFKDNVTHVGGRSPHDQHTESDEYGKKGWVSGVYLDKGTIAAAEKTHEAQNAADQKTLAPLQAAVDQAKAAKTTADGGVTTAQKALDTVNASNQDLADQKTQTAARVAEEQAALKPDASIDKASRVQAGGGYYQTAEALLGIPDKGKHTTMQEKELKELTKMLQDEERALNGGHLPKYLKQNDVLLKPENLEEVMDKLKAKQAPPAPPKAANT